MEYKSVRISDVIRDLNRDYYLPNIQREFVWEPQRIERLFDSLMSDFPIGSFLFWKVREENKNDWDIYEFIRDYNQEQPHNKLANLSGITRDIYLVLDGQQRLTSFYIGLKGYYKYFYYRWRKTKLYLNLLKAPIPNEDNPEELTYQFCFREDGENKDDELWYEVGRILDFNDAEYAKSDIKNEISHLPDNLRERANILIGRLHNKIHTISLVNYYEEKTQDYDKVLNIFIRANSSGKPLEYSDLLLSTATAKWTDYDARKEIYEFSDHINSLGPGFDFGKDFILKSCLYLTENLPIQYQVKNFNKSNLSKIEKNWDTIKTYIATTIRLISKFGFNYKNIVAPLALLPVIYFLMKKGNPNFDKSSYKDDVDIQLDIRRWIIIVMLKNAFGSSTDRRLKNLRDIMSNNKMYDKYPVDILNNELGIKDKLSFEEIEELFSIPYQGKYTFLFLSLMYPNMDWKGQKLHEDHIFPKSDFDPGKLRKRNYDDNKINEYRSFYNTVLNIQLLTDSENLTKSSAFFDQWIDSVDGNFKKRHLIPDMVNYKMDNFLDFIAKRKELFRSILLDI